LPGDAGSDQRQSTNACWINPRRTAARPASASLWVWYGLTAVPSSGMAAFSGELETGEAEDDGRASRHGNSRRPREIDKIPQRISTQRGGHDRSRHLAEEDQIVRSSVPVSLRALRSRVHRKTIVVGLATFTIWPVGVSLPVV
jgi:hypothetical protein